MAKLRIAKELIDILYPIGYVYLSWNNIDPGTWLDGTTWERHQNGYLFAATKISTETLTNTSGLASSVWSGTTGNAAPGTNNTGAHTHNYGVQYAAYYGAFYDSDEKLLRLYNGSTNKYVAGKSTNSQEKTSGNYNVYPGMGSTFSSNIYQNLQPTSSNGSHSHTVNSHNHSIPEHYHNLNWIAVFVFVRTA